MAFSIPNTDDGTGHFGSSLDYFPGGIQAGGATPTNTALQNAQRLAAFCDVVKGNIQVNPTNNKITTDKWNGLADDMLLINPNLVNMVYTKGDEISPSDAYNTLTSATVFPTDYYAHASSWPGGPKLTTFSGNIYVAQPSTTPQNSAYSDPRGWTSHSFPEQRARDAWSIVSIYNAAFGAGVISAVFSDSVGGGTFKSGTPQVKPDGSGAYTRSTWETDMWTNLSQQVRNTRNPHPGVWPVFCNSLKDGTNIQHAGSGLNTIGSVNGSPGVWDGGFSEGFLRANFASPTAFFTETQWQQCVDGAIAVQSAGSYIWQVNNLCNATAGSGTCPFTTDAQRNQWRRYTFCTYLLSNRGKCLFEFVDTTATKPYDEIANNLNFYQVDLGSSTESPSATGMKHAGTVGSIYYRTYTLGRVFVNPTGSSVSWTADQDYYLVNATGGRSGTKLVASGATLTLAANDGVIGYFAPPAPPPPPAVSLVSPTSGSTVNTSTVQIIVSAADANGTLVNSVTCKVGSGSVQNMTQSAGTNQWTLNVTLAAGSNTLTIKATDAASNTTTITPTVTFTAVVVPLTCAFQSPFGNTTVTQTVNLVQVLITGGTGASPGQQTGSLTVNGGPSIPLTYNAATGFHEVVITLVAGSTNLLVATASFQAQAVAVASETIIVNTGNSGGGGGGGGNPIVSPGGSWRGPWISQQPGGEEE